MILSSICDKDFVNTRLIFYSLDPKYLIPKMMLGSIIYGGILINWVDSVSWLIHPIINEYWVWLTIMHFVPFIIFSLINPFYWEFTISFGLLSSTWNDLLWGIFAKEPITWYLHYFNPFGFKVYWTLEFLWIKIPVTPCLMFFATTGRILLSYLLIMRGYRTFQTPGSY